MSNRKRKRVKPAGSGRKRGTPNRVTTSMKGAVLEAFDALGGAEGLTKWAKTKAGKPEFYKIASKLIPTEIQGANNGPLIVVTRVE